MAGLVPATYDLGLGALTAAFGAARSVADPVGMGGRDKPGHDGGWVEAVGRAVSLFRLAWQANEPFVLFVFSVV